MTPPEPVTQVAAFVRTSSGATSFPAVVGVAPTTVWRYLALEPSGRDAHVVGGHDRDWRERIVTLGLGGGDAQGLGGPAPIAHPVDAQPTAAIVEGLGHLRCEFATGADILRALRRIEFKRSGVLAAAEYDDSAGTLTIELRNGGVYRYFLVPGRVFEALAAAPSAGRYFVDHIRDRYSQVRLREKDA